MNEVAAAVLFLIIVLCIVVLVVGYFYNVLADKDYEESKEDDWFVG